MNDQNIHIHYMYQIVALVVGLLVAALLRWIANRYCQERLEDEGLPNAEEHDEEHNEERGEQHDEQV